MEWVVQIVLAVIALLGGGMGVFAFIINRKKEGRADFDIIVTTWKADNDRLRKREGELSKRVDDLEKALGNLRTKIVLLESAHMDLPIPMWLKDLDGRMLALNGAYEETFLLPNGKTAEEYVGHTDYDIWPPEIAEQFMAHDKQVQKSGRTFFGSEMVPIGGEEFEFRIIKYVRYAGRAKIGIGGLAIPLELVQ